MRKYLVFILSLLCLLGHAQDKLFNEAIKRGPNDEGIYRIENTQKKDVDLWQMQNFIQKKGYFPLGGDLQTVSRFGSAYKVMRYYYFTDKEHYVGYVYMTLSSHKPNNLKSRGLLFLTQLEGEKGLRKWRNALWSGNVVDGYIDGVGEGIYTDNKTYYWFTGSFECGLPVSKVEIKTITPKQAKIGSNDYVHGDKCSPIDKSWILMLYNTEDQELSKALKSYNTKSYASDVKKLEAAYDKTRSVNISNYANCAIDKAVDEFATYYGKIGYDPQNMLPKAHAVLEFYGVLSALQMKIADRYYGNPGWPFNLLYELEWYGSKEKYDKKTINDAIELASSSSLGNKFGYSNFYSQAVKELKSKYTKLLDRLYSNALEYEEALEDIRAEQKVKNQELSKEINWDKSKSPSGDLVRVGLFDDRLHYENRGRLVMKYGSDFIEYNTYYFSGGRDLDGVEIEIVTSDELERKLGDDLHKKFKSVGDMVKAIENALKK